MKQTKYILATIAMLFCSLVVSAHDFEVDGIYYNITSNTEAEVTFKGNYYHSYSNEYSGSITLPATVTYNGKEYSVTSIGYEAFSYCSSLTSITIPESVTSIGEWAFSGCSSLTSITIPEGVTSIGNYAFSGCSGLAAITIPEGVTSIGDDAFYSCDGLTSITIPEGVTSIGSSAFAGCSSLTSMVVAEGNTKYDSRNNCNAIIETSSNTLTHGCSATIIPESVTSIGYYAFSWCSSLTAITIPEGVTSIGDHAFLGCSKLTAITIPEGVTSIGRDVFGDCRSLTSITIPEGVTSIEEWAFAGCSSLTAITCNAATPPTIYGSSTFFGVDKSIPVYVPAGSVEAYKATEYWSEFTNIQAISSDIASGTCGDNLTWRLTEEYELIIEGTGEMYDGSSWEGYEEAVKSITIGEGVTSIGDICFWNFSNLEVLTIPGSLTKIGGNPFYGCTELYTILLKSENPVYDIYDGNVVEKNSGTVVIGCRHVPAYSNVTKVGDFAYCGRGLSSIVIPESITSIGYAAFSENEDMTSITIPESVTSIGDHAFANCQKLTSVNIPEGVTKIGDWTFLQCYSLTSIEIPSSVTELGNLAFGLCESVTSITCMATNPPAAGNSFQGIDKSIPVYVPAGSVEAYKAANEWSEFTNFMEVREVLASGTCGENLTWTLFEDGELVIEGTGAMTDYTYYAVAPWHNYRTSIEKITIEEGVTSIGFKVFDGCINLTSVTIPEGVTSIAGSAFYNCSSLTSINIPEGVMSIGYEAFNGCGSLTAINIPESMTSIGGHPFKYCSSLTSIVVAEGNRIYDSRNGCNAIIESSSNTLIQGCSSTIIPEGVMSIGDCAFEGCSDLTSVNLPEGMRSIGGWAFKACNSLISVAIPEGVTSIRESAFEGCTNLAELNIPEGVTSIGGSAFEGCINLTQLNIPEGLTCINNYTFKGCSGLTEIRIPASVMTIEFEAFMNCANLATVTFAEESRLEGIAASAFCYCNSLTDIVIPMDVTSIGTWAFEGCTSLVSVTIPKRMQSIGAKAFKTCSSLQEFYCYAESVPETPEGNTFEETPIENVTLYVPTSVVAEYKATAPWSSFGNVVGNTIEIVTGITLNQTSTTLIVGNSLTLTATIIPSYATNPSVTWSSSNESIASVDDMGQVVAIAPGTVTITATAKDGSGVSASCEITVEQLYVDYVTITINQYGSGTYSSEYALDFSEVMLLKAYVATGYNHLTGEVTLLRVHTAEAGTGLLVKGIPGMSYKVPVLESTADHTLNMLVATQEKTKVNGHSDDGVYANYKYTVVKEQSPEPLFYQFADGASLSAGKAYLQIPVAWLPATGQRALRYRFDEGETTDIEDEEIINHKSEIIYDLYGRRVQSPKKGEVYIINNKKVVY